jgi:uncharacterized protein DUF4430
VEGGFVFRRTLVLAALAALVAVPAAFSSSLPHIRVEGRDHTIFGPTEPRVTAVNALEALTRASHSGEFFVHVADTPYGPYVDQIGLYAAFGSSGWAYKVNGISPPVAADQYVLKPGDDVLWYWAFFGLNGGPKTLELKHSGQCYRVFEENDQGQGIPAEGAVMHIGGRSVKTKAGRACVGPHRGLVKATLSGDVRSNAIP